MPKLRPLNWSPWGSVTPPYPFPVTPVTGNGHGRVPSPTWCTIEVIGDHTGGPMRIGKTLLTANEIAGLVAFWAWSLRDHEIKQVKHFNVRRTQKMSSFTTWSCLIDIVSHERPWECLHTITRTWFYWIYSYVPNKRRGGRLFILAFWDPPPPAPY